MVVSKFEFGDVLSLFWRPWGQNRGQIEVKLQISHLIWSLGAKNLHEMFFQKMKSVMVSKFEFWNVFTPFRGTRGQNRVQKGQNGVRQGSKYQYHS